MTDFTHHTPKLLTEADAAADLAGVPRPVPSVGTEDARALADKHHRSAMAIQQLDDILGITDSANKIKTHQSTADMLRAFVSERDELASRVRELEDLLGEVSRNFTREDDLPDELLPRIDAALASKEQP